MKINPSTKSSRKQLNKEGVVVWKENKYRDLIISGMNLNPRQNRFYFSTDEQIQNFIELAKEVFDKDSEFIPSLAKYLASIGRKTSPAILTALVMSDNYEKGGKHKNPTYLKMVKRIDNKLFRTPKQMAEACYMFTQLTGQPFKKIPKKYKIAMRGTLESYDRITLVKNRLRRRVVKLADLIKVLRPKPVNSEMSKLYKDIIENRVRLNENDKEVMAVVTLSDNKLSKEEKIKKLEQSIDKIPFNMLVRNLSQFRDSDFDVKQKIYNRFKSVLESIKKGDESTIQVVNPFILLDIVESDVFQYLGGLKDIIDAILIEYLNYIKQQNIIPPNKKYGILIDISGSMYGVMEYEVSKFLTVFSYLLDIPNTKFAVFNFYTIYEDINDDIVSLKKFPVKSILKLKDTLKHVKSPTEKYHKVIEIYRSMIGGGTALVDAVKKFLYRYTDTDTLFVFTDEMAWADEYKTTELKHTVDRLPGDKHIIIINPVHTAQQGVVIPNNRILKITSLSPSMFTYMKLFTNVSEFVKWIKENY